MPALDTFNNNGTGLTSPLQNGFTITPHDSNELSHVTREIYVGTGGDLTLTLKSGDSITLNSVPSGARLPYRTRLVAAAGTTATDLVGLY